MLRVSNLVLICASRRTNSHFTNVIREISRKSSDLRGQASNQDDDVVTKIKTDDNTFVARKKNETFVVEAGTNLVFVNDTIGIDGSGRAGGRTIRVDGSLSAPVDSSFAIQMDCSTKKAERIIVGSTGEVAGTRAAILVDGLIDIRVAGKVEGGRDAIFLPTGIATIRNSGIIEGGTNSAVNSISGELTLKNSGQIVSDDANAIVALGESCTIENSGSIEAIGTTSAIAVIQADFDLTNTGTVLAEGGTAIFLGGSSDVGKVTIVNEGTIAGLVAAIAVQSGLSNDVLTIVNTGEIIGDVDLFGSERNDVVNTSNGLVEGDILTGAGSDRIVLINAIVTGQVQGGLGDDVYTISSNDITIIEKSDEGADTVRATGNVSITLAANFENLTLIGKSDTQATGNGVDNVLTGNAGNNVIDGAAGEDTIRGGKGLDQLIGGADVDTFIFRKGDGKDVIGDFDIGVATHDFLDLSGIKGITNFDDLIDNHAKDIDGDVVINAGKGDRIVLEGLTVDDLRAEMFFL